MKKLEGGKYEVCGLTFRRDKISDPAGLPVVIYSEDNGKPSSFMVRITREGMTFRGDLSGWVSSEKEIQSLAAFMSEWVRDVRSLRPRLTLDVQETLDKKNTQPPGFM